MGRFILDEKCSIGEKVEKSGSWSRETEGEEGVEVVAAYSSKSHSGNRKEEKKTEGSWGLFERNKIV